MSRLARRILSKGDHSSFLDVCQDAVSHKLADPSWDLKAEVRVRVGSSGAQAVCMPWPASQHLQISLQDALWLLQAYAVCNTVN